VGGGIGDFDTRFGTGGGPIAPGLAADRKSSAASAPASAAVASTGGPGADSAATGCSVFLPVLRFLEGRPAVGVGGSGWEEGGMAGRSSLNDLPRAAARTTALPFMAEALCGLDDGATTGVVGGGGSFLFRGARDGVIGGGGGGGGGEGGDGFTGLAREDLRKPVAASGAAAGEAEVAGEERAEEKVD
jgi:hypothetical protein